MARAIANATLAFGMVAIPVKVYPATGDAKSVSFKQLCPTCKTPPKQQYHCEGCAALVARDEMLKGYEVTKGNFLVFSPDEIKALDAESTKTIDIREFVPEGSIPATFFDKPYYLGAETAGQRAYSLLTEALRRAKRVAIAQFALRGNEYLVAVAPTEAGLAMYQLRYDHQVRPQEVQLEVKLADAEINMALALIDRASAEAFNPSGYIDNVFARKRAAIEAKMAGSPVLPPPVPKAPQVVDLMAALQASLAAPAPVKPVATATADTAKVRKPKAAPKAAPKARKGAKK